MKLLLVAIASFVISVKADYSSEWKIFKKEYQKIYKTEEEEKFREEIYQNNSRLIREHNIRYAKLEVLFDLGMNQFGDLTQEEFEEMMLNYHDDVNSTCHPEKFDAGDHSFGSQGNTWNFYDSPVKNQGQCGASWAFSAIAALESYFYRLNESHATFSEQNLIDCTLNNNNDGCKGGAADRAFQYIKEQGINSNEFYPYTGEEGDTCLYDENKSLERIQGCKILPPDNELQLEIAIDDIGPVAVSLFAGSFEFRFYKTGIFYSEQCFEKTYTDTNHEALVVAHGKQNGIAYWLVKNSWGKKWGDKGYFQIAKNANSHCGIASHSTYPIFGSEGN